jgi:hypothetical protein
MHSLTLLVSLFLIAVPFTVLAQYDMLIAEGPHLRSINNGYEVCDYWSNTWFSCFDSPFFQANCISAQTSISTGIKAYLFVYIKLLKI